MKWLIKLFHLREHPSYITPLLQNPYLTHTSKHKTTDSRCYFLSWHTFPFVCSKALCGNATTLIELLFQQPCGRDGLGWLHDHAPCWKFHLTHQDGLPGRHWVLQKKPWDVSGSKGIKVVSDLVACSRWVLQPWKRLFPESSGSFQVLGSYCSPPSYIYAPGMNALDRGGHLTRLSLRKLNGD